MFTFWGGLKDPQADAWAFWQTTKSSLPFGLARGIPIAKKS